jgi:hypothetical protein
MYKWGSDKGKPDNNGWHNYTTYYYELFNPVRHSPIRIFELGLGTNNTSIPSNMGVNGKPGASLRGWREFFPNAHVFGADIDTGILFNEDRINTFYCDQLSADAIKTMWANESLTEGFDIIIEDGLHTFEANKSFFENSIHKLNKGGVYIIEDLHNNIISTIHNQIEEWKKVYPHLQFNILCIPHDVNNHDNNLLVIQYI